MAATHRDDLNAVALEQAEELAGGAHHMRAFRRSLRASVRQPAVAQTDERPADRLAEHLPPPPTVRERPTRQEDRSPRHER